MDDVEYQKMITSFTQRLANEAPTYPGDLQESVSKLIPVLHTETILFAHTLAPATASIFFNNIFNICNNTITSESIYEMLNITGQMSLEYYMISGRCDGAASEFINAHFNKNQSGWSLENIGVISRVASNMLKFQHGKAMAEITDSSSYLTQQSNYAKKEIDSHVTYLQESQSTLKEYKERFEELRSELNFTLLGKAFQDFINKKILEKRCLLGLLFLLAAFIIYVPNKLVEYSLTNKVLSDVGETNSASLESVPVSSKIDATKITKTAETKLETKNSQTDGIKWNPIINRLFLLFPVAIIELLLLFFFKIILGHYNAAGAQILQLKMRLAVCQFIEDYIKFKRDKDIGELDKFEALIFSNLMPDADKIPSSFDGLEQLGKILSESFKSKPT